MCDVEHRLYGIEQMRPPDFDLCLIVDDDEDILTTARLLLRAMFREIVTAASPERAIAAVEGRPPT